jgi:hypothetical protein
MMTGNTIIASLNSPGTEAVTEVSSDHLYGTIYDLPSQRVRHGIEFDSFRNSGV